MRIAKLLFSWLVVLLIAACGGGGGGSTSTPVPAATYTVGGAVTGLGSGNLVLKNSGGDALTINANSNTFTFATTLTESDAYIVTIDTQPTGYTCSLSNSSGTMRGANVTNIQVSCSTISYSVSGTILGLAASGLKLTNGSELLTISSGATTFAFASNVAFGGAYAVTVDTQPTGQICYVRNGSGIASSNVNVSISCQVGFTIGPFSTDIYGNTTGGALSGGFGTNLNFGSWANIMKFFNTPTPSATTSTGSIDSSGLFSPGAATGSFTFDTRIFINQTSIGTLQWVSNANHSLGLTLARAGHYSGPTVTSGTTISGFNGWITLTPITTSLIVWSDSSNSSISSAQTNDPFHGPDLIIITNSDVSTKTLPATIQTSNYTPAPP